MAGKWPRAERDGYHSVAMSLRSRRETYATVRPIALAIVAGMIAAAPRAARSQWQGPTRVDAGGSLQVGGEAERYLRVIELAGLAPQQPWTIRPLAPSAPTGDHPWRARWTQDLADSGPRLRWLRPVATAALNTSFAYNVIPGPAWTGRGFTGQATGGFVAEWGRLRAQVEPTAFVAQNAAFDLAPNGLGGSDAFRDARFPKAIDLPQRFGTATYARFDPGNTTLSLDLSPALVGVSSASESWGPAREFPLVLSANSGGFPHGFVATARPLDLWLFRLHGRMIGGTLQHSAFTTPVPDPLRWISGIALTIMPRGVEGLELGGSRMVSAYSRSGIPSIANLRRLFARGLHATLPTGGDNIAAENQMASVWFRWAVPATRTEFYGEYYRDDYSLDMRWFLQYPDDYATYTVGVQHVAVRGAGRLRAYRFELLNGEVSSSNKRQHPADPTTGRTRLAGPLPPYIHTAGVRDGHTNHGLLLGSPEAYGGAAVRVGVDDYDSRGRTSLTFERQLRFDWLPGIPADAMARPDVILSIRAERFRFAGAREIGITVMPMLDVNRDIRPGNDRFNLAAAFSVRGLR